MDAARIVMLVAAGLHLGFVLGEMLPWHCPFILKKVIANKSLTYSADQLKLVATIVRNAGIYNLIMTAGLLWTVCPDSFGWLLEPSAVKAVRCFFLSGAVVAGVFGLTLSPITIVQAIVGLGLVCFA